jgi:polyhydroxyalkanoate synthesis regulator phasin
VCSLSFGSIYDSFLFGQIKELEAELNKDWEERSQRLLKTEQERHEREMKAMQEEKTTLEEKVTALENKVILFWASSQLDL